MSLVDGSKVMVAGLAAAALLVGAQSADAKVILTQPEVKNFVKNTAPASSSSSKSAPAVKRSPPAAQTSDGFDFKPLVLPLTLVTVVGGGFALTSVDPGFAEMMVEGGAKDSRFFAGYETGLKDTPFYGGTGGVPSSSPLSGGKAAPPKKKGGKKFF